jgi:hypothetical protein
LLGLLAPLLLGINFIGPRMESNNWMIRIDQRTRAAAARIRGRKIIFVGGSNLIFGLRAGSLSSRIGYPVVNYGLPAGVGADVIAERASELIGPDDVVVLATETVHYPLIEYRSSSIRGEFIAYVARERQLFGLAFARERCTILREALQKRIMSLQPHYRDAPISPYSLEALGPDGSLRFPRPENHMALKVTAPGLDGSDADVARSVAARAFVTLQEKCRQRHATLAVMPPFHLTAPRTDASLLVDRERRWLALATADGAVQLLGPGETSLESRFGYDSDYHLNDAGVEIMEKRLATALTRLLKSETGPQVHLERTAAPNGGANVMQASIKSSALGVGK